MIRQIKEDQCLSSCSWQENPFFKTQPEGDLAHYGAKWWEEKFTNKNTFPQLHDAPMVPRDLRCLEGCFDKYFQDTSHLKKVQRHCSEIGLDRQVPTHTKEGYDLVQSNFSDLVNWANADSERLPLNPNLDCLVYYKTNERRGCRIGNDGVCNFIPEQKEVQKERNLGTQKKHENIETNITDENDYRPFILRASSPVSRAIEICALAKLIQFHGHLNDNEGEDFIKPEAVNLFSPTTCDHFMPDIFGSLCSCVGSCATNRNFDPYTENDSNLILHFYTGKGLWGCQDACKRTKNCEFYTHSELSFFPGAFKEQDKYKEIPDSPVFHCLLWKHCDNFFIPDEPGHWQVISGPKDCSLYTQLCPVVKNQGDTLNPLPTGYTSVPCSDTTYCGFEVQVVDIPFHL